MRPITIVSMRDSILVLKCKGKNELGYKSGACLVKYNLNSIVCRIGISYNYGSFLSVGNHHTVVMSL